VSLQVVKDPVLEVVKHTDLHCIKEVGLKDVGHDTGNLSKHVGSSVNMARQEFSITCLGVGIADRSIQVVLPLGVMLVWRDIISKLVLWTLAPKRDMLLEMM